MRVALASLPLIGADRGRSFRRVALAQLPSPLMGEGGGEDTALSPIPTFSRTGEGVLISRGHL
jgi:hypothetical protein